MFLGQPYIYVRTACKREFSFLAKMLKTKDQNNYKYQIKKKKKKKILRLTTSSYSA